MSDTLPTREDTLPPDLVLCLDAACDRFEAAWKAGSRPRIEDFLHEVPEPWQSVLVRELVLLDVAYRRRQGETPDPGEYERRFAALNPGWLGRVLGVVGTLGRYRVDGEVGHGGMGAVLRAYDPHMGRELAVKVLQEQHRGEPHLVRRFFEEARIGGRLQHPGIVPVYELGELPADGPGAPRQPYFTMKLVEGRTLADLLADRPEPARDLPRFLGIFEQVCQTLAYAHSRGVIHRDLKPANVMVGSFGEVQVMDWGLAKVLDRGQQTPAGNGASGGGPRTQGHLDDMADPLRTQPGQAMGTLSYMPPEQARGELERVDERSDVFGLGAMLCKILTGQPPFTGQDGEEVFAKAKACDHAEALAQLDGCGADAELLRLAQACLAAEPEDRPRDAGAVARELTAYLAGVQERLRQAGLERAAAETRVAEERKRRRVKTALATALLALMAVGGGTGWWWQRQRAERRQGVEAALARVAELQQRDRWDEARAVLDQAADRLGSSGPRDLRERVDQARADLALVARLDAIRLKRATRLTGLFGRPFIDNRDYEACFIDWGIVPVVEDVEVVAARIRASAIREQLVAALDDWVTFTEDPARRAWSMAVVRKADSDTWRDLFRAPVEWDRDALRDLVGEVLRNDGAKVAELPPQLLSRLAMMLGAVQEDNLPLLKAAQRRYPNDFWLNVELGHYLNMAHKNEEAVGYIRAALAIRPKTAALYAALGVNQWANGRLDEAAMAYRRATELDPKVAYLHRVHGETLFDKDQLDEAIEAFHKALELDPNDASTHGDLGHALFAKSRLDEAITALRQAIKLGLEDAACHNRLGQALQNKGKLDEAIRQYRKALELDPKHALAHNNLGSALEARGQVEEAMQHYCAALELDPKLAAAHNNLGLALAAKGQLDQAMQHYRLALELDPKAAPAHNSLGLALAAKGQLDEAMQHYRAALELDPKHAPAHNNLGIALAAKGQLDQAMQHYRLALELDPKLAAAHNNLGLALAAKGQLDEAIQAYRAAVELDPKNAKAHSNFGDALRDKKQLDEAIKEYRAALAIDPEIARAHNDLGQALADKGQLDEAIQEYRAALAIDPKIAWAHHNLGDALRDKKQLDEAIQEYRAELALDSKSAVTHYNLGSALANKGQLDEAIKEFRAAVENDPKWDYYYIALGDVLRYKGQLDESIREYRTAISFNPKSARAHIALGSALRANGQLDEAIKEHRAAIAIDSKIAMAHNNLGRALADKGQLDEAIQEYRAALDIDPKIARTHYNLGSALANKGHLDEAIGEYRAAVEIDPKDATARSSLLAAERLVQVEPKLPLILDGKKKPADAAESLALAQLCQEPFKKLFAASARFYAEAFARDAKLAAKMQQQHRYHAACAAALAGCGQGKGADKLDDKERARLREQALDWLKADLACWTKQADSDKPEERQTVQQTLKHWQTNADFTGVRGKDALAKLPQVEHEAWCKLWEEVETLLVKARSQK
jgi:serine/threonine-protein kinase